MKTGFILGSFDNTKRILVKNLKIVLIRKYTKAFRSSCLLNISFRHKRTGPVGMESRRAVSLSKIEKLMKIKIKKIPNGGIKI